MVKNNENKEKILNYLKALQDWVTTTNISVNTSINYYKAESLLNILLLENLVEKDEKNYQTFWRAKNAKEV